MPLPLDERDVQKQVRDYLAIRGWRVLRMQSGMFQNQAAQPFRVGEPGMPDLLALNYRDNGVALALWVEVKKPGAIERCYCKPGRPKLCRTCSQKRWRETEQRRGAIVHRVDDIAWFIDWYEREFAWLHSGQHAKGQLDMLVGSAI